MATEKGSSSSKKDDPEFMVEQAIASLSIEGIRVPADEREILRKIANGELDADEVADAIAQAAIHRPHACFVTTCADSAKI